MTEQEAIKALKFDMEMILFDPYEGKKRTPEEVKNINEANYLCYLADEMAIKALEKQIAKKPLGTTMAKDKDTSVGSIGRCPCCDGIVAEDMLWCDDCGQKLDWE